MISHIGKILDRFDKPEGDPVVHVIKSITTYEIKKTSYQMKKGVLIIKNISPLLKTKILILKQKIIKELSKQDISVSDII